MSLRSVRELVLLDFFLTCIPMASSRFLSFIQTERLQFVRDQLCFSGLGPQVQPLPSVRTGPELQQPEEVRCSAAEGSCKGSEVSRWLE